MAMDKEFFERVEMSLKHANMTWSGAAVALGYSAQASSNWKNGKISNKVVEQLANLLKVDVCWLCFGEQYGDGSGCNVKLPTKRFSKLIQIFEEIDSEIENGKLTNDQITLLNGTLDAIALMSENANKLVASWLERKSDKDNESQKTA